MQPPLWAHPKFYGYVASLRMVVVVLKRMLLNLPSLQPQAGPAWVKDDSARRAALRAAVARHLLHASRSLRGPAAANNRVGGRSAHFGPHKVCAETPMHRAISDMLPATQRAAVARLGRPARASARGVRRSAPHDAPSAVALHIASHLLFSSQPNSLAVPTPGPWRNAPDARRPRWLMRPGLSAPKAKLE